MWAAAWLTDPRFETGLMMVSLLLTMGVVERWRYPGDILSAQPRLAGSILVWLMGALSAALIATLVGLVHATPFLTMGGALAGLMFAVLTREGATSRD